MQQIFWAFVGTAIGVAVLSHVLNQILYYQRITASRTSPTAANPKSLFFKTHASIAAIIREFGYYSVPISIRNHSVYIAPLGPATLLVGYLVLIVVCSLYAFDTENVLEWEDVGYRSGYIAICQIPFVVLLAGKRNIIGSVTGLGYERLAWLHRWVARSLLFATVIHAGFFLREWAKYEYILIKIKEDPITQKGIAAGSVLLWIILSSVAPIRGLSYEVFVVQHILSWLGFLFAIYLHVPAENHIWLWLPLAFWGFDRVVRAVYLAYNNLSIFHKNSSGFLACKATFEPLDESHTRITIQNPPVTWEAGQHLFLACHAVAPLSSHPFTIASIPSDGKIEFIVCAKKGGTKRFFAYAAKTYPSLSLSGNSTRQAGRSVLIDGPYSRIRTLRQFDSVLFLAGSTGATFTVPLMRDLVQQWKGLGSTRRWKLDPPGGAVTRCVHFVWVVKKRSSVTWFAEQFERASRDVENLRQDGYNITLALDIYVTSDADMSTITETESGDVSISLSRKETAVSDVRSSSSTTISFEKPSSAAQIRFLSGRPNAKNLIRQTAEQALGEMAVVVCGPQGLVQSTRNAAASVSDDRGVHKGTGAQGIYVHAETFGYA